MNRFLAMAAVILPMSSWAMPDGAFASPRDDNRSQAAPAQSRPATTKPDESKPARVEVKAVDLRAGDDKDKRYFLIGPHDLSEPPKDGFKLLLVLPGGDGSAEFTSFVQTIYKLAMPKGYVLAQLVAPAWSNDQAKNNVWPTKSNSAEGARFTTEEFIEAVIDDVSKRCTIDSGFIFSLSWSSGGPAAYAASLTQNSRITGSFVAMSVFNPRYLPDLKGAKGKSYYILHSPQDFIKMRFPEAARDELAKNGAATKLETYEGGHGWHGDVFERIRKGIEWLEEQRAKNKQP